MRETYLGDGVYASFDGYQIWLDTRGQSPVNRIALEPQVFDALLKYSNRIDQARKAAMDADEAAASPD